MTLCKIKRLTLLLFIAGGFVTGQTLEDISIVDSETSYFLTLTFDEVPKYRTSEVYEPPHLLSHLQVRIGAREILPVE